MVANELALKQCIQRVGVSNERIARQTANHLVGIDACWKAQQTLRNTDREVLDWRHTWVRVIDSLDITTLVEDIVHAALEQKSVRDDTDRHRGVGVIAAWSITQLASRLERTLLLRDCRILQRKGARIALDIERVLECSAWKHGCHRCLGTAPEVATQRIDSTKSGTVCRCIRQTDNEACTVVVDRVRIDVILVRRHRSLDLPIERCACNRRCGITQPIVLNDVDVGSDGGDRSVVRDKRLVEDNAQVIVVRVDSRTRPRLVCLNTHAVQKNRIGTRGTDAAL